MNLNLDLLPLIRNMMFRKLFPFLFAVLFLAGCDSDLKDQIKQRDNKITALTSERNSLKADLEKSQAQMLQLQAQLDEINQAGQPTEADKALQAGLKKSFAKEMQDGQMEIGSERRRTYLQLDEAVFFGSGSAAPRPGGIRILEKLAKELKKHQGYYVVVEGHTDKMPISQRLRLKFASNLELSATRATSVSYYLQNELKVRMPMIAVAYGPLFEAATNKTSKGRAKNRRVRVTLVPVGEKPI
ncbi:MAG: OmpA family protein [bacterium]|nr:OmpA family protein [bacterium]